MAGIQMVRKFNMRLAAISTVWSVALVIVFLEGCYSPEKCSYTVLSSSDNQSGGVQNVEPLEAQVVREDCGTLVHSMTSVRIIEKSRGRAFGLADGRVFRYVGDSKIDVSWSDPLTLQIKCAKCVDAGIILNITKSAFVSIKRIN